MIAVLLKFLHIVAIAAWSGGLICLPFLYLQRYRLSGEALHRLHNFTRFFYVALVSPAAFVAIGSGTALIFVQATFEAWFSLKLALVAGMVVIHITSGAMILRLFEPGHAYPLWRFMVVTALTTAVVGLILIIVLGKPEWITPRGIATLMAPGVLGDVLGGLIAWWK